MIGKGNWLKAFSPKSNPFTPFTPKAVATGPTPLAGGSALSIANLLGTLFRGDDSKDCN